MQDTFLPLDEIKKRITHLTLEEVKNEIKQELSSIKVEETTEIYASAKSLGVTYSKVNSRLWSRISYSNWKSKGGGTGG